MKNFISSLTHKILFASLLLLAIAFGFVWFYIIPSYEQQLKNMRIEAAAQTVDVAFTMLDRIRQSPILSRMPESSVKNRALGFLQEVRYNRFQFANNIGYLWVHDLQAVMLMHPFQPSLVGQNLDEFRDAKQIRVFHDMNQLVQKRGAGIIHYNWPLPNGTIPVAKISYVRLYKPWGWVIGSGIYLDDIVQQTAIIRNELLIGMVLLFAVCTVLVMLLAGWINRPYMVMHRFAEQIWEQIDPKNALTHPEDDAGLAIEAMQQMLKEMEQAKDEAERANEVKSRFLAMTSHDLRTPLANIAGLTELMKNDYPPMSVKQQEYASLIATSSFNLLQLINDLLDLSKIEAGKFELDYESVNIGELIAEVVQLQMAAATFQSTTINIPPSEPLMPLIYADPLRIRQILTNLISNAIKFTQNGTVTVQTAIEPLPDNLTPCNDIVWPDGVTVNFLELIVSDTGIGMTAEQIERIFKPYAQASKDTSRQYGGTGLGLSIVAQLSGLMGGEATASSTLETGSRFVCRIQVGVYNEQ